MDWIGSDWVSKNWPISNCVWSRCQLHDGSPSERRGHVFKRHQVIVESNWPRGPSTDWSERPSSTGNRVPSATRLPVDHVHADRLYHTMFCNCFVAETQRQLSCRAVTVSSWQEGWVSQTTSLKPRPERDRTTAANKWECENRQQHRRTSMEIVS